MRRELMYDCLRKLDSLVELTRLLAEKMSQEDEKNYCLLKAEMIDVFAKMAIQLSLVLGILDDCHGSGCKCLNGRSQEVKNKKILKLTYEAADSLAAADISSIWAIQMGSLGLARELEKTGNAIRNAMDKHCIDSRGKRMECPGDKNLLGRTRMEVCI